jgi:hypothetical protein
MMRRSNNDFLEFIYKPLCIVILLFGLFGMVWLRAGVVSISYDLRNLEEKKMEALKDMKMLLADRSKVISLANISSTLQSQGQRQDNGDYKRVSSGYVFTDRVKVIHVKKRTVPETFKASLEIKK